MRTSPERIAIYVPSLRGGGAERMMVNLAKGFTEKGYRVDLVLAKAEGPYVSHVPEAVRVVDVGARRVLYSLPGLVNYIRRERPQAMLSTLNHANIVAIWARKLSGASCRLVVREATTLGVSARRSRFLGEKLAPLLARFFYPRADLIVATSRASAEDLIHTAKLARERVHVIYNPVATPDLFEKAQEQVDHPWFVSGQPPVVLGVGRLTDAKDFPTLVHAFARLRRGRLARLMILGEGEMRVRLEAMVRHLNLSDDVLLPGFVDNPYQWMRLSRLFVLSSRWEGLPGALIEAMACGTPVVSTDCPGGVAEILENGRWGCLVPPGDEVALAEGMAKALDDPNPPDVLQRARDFSLENAVTSYLRVLGCKND